MPGEFRPLKDALGCEQVAVTLIRVPPHSDFEQGTGHSHEEIEEVYIVTGAKFAGIEADIPASVRAYVDNLWQRPAFQRAAAVK